MGENAAAEIGAEVVLHPLRYAVVVGIGRCGVGRALMRNHLTHCAGTALRAGGEEAESMYDEIIDLMYRHAR